MKLRAMIALASAALLTLVLSLTSVAGTPPCPPGGDPDADGLCDDQGLDNCTAIANPGQRDDDQDGYGNICDEDVNQDCIVGAPDVSGVFGQLLQTSPWVPVEAGRFDVTEDNIVGAPDLSQTFGRLLQQPGPSSRACADCNAAAGGGVCP